MRIAIIGGIGSGKSEAMKIAAELGFFTLSADEINSVLLQSPEYIKEIAAAFPSVVNFGKLDRRKLADIVFANDEELKKLNAIAHPSILRRIAEEKADPLVAEMPLFYEIGAQKLFDKTILIYAPLEIRLERLAARGMSERDALARINAQADEGILLQSADFVVDNSGSLSELRENVTEAFKSIIRFDKIH